MALDVRTLYVAIGTSCFVVTGAFLLLPGSSVQDRGSRPVSLGYAFQGVYWILVGFRGVIPDFISVVAANCCLTASYALLYTAVRAFQKRQYSRELPFLWAMIATFIYMTIFWAYVDSLPLRALYIFFWCPVSRWHPSP